MIVFTNGCFDVLHPGHIELLKQARLLGSRLIVGINSDDSVRRIKGNGRPLFSAEERKSVLLALESVDEVIVFEEATPELLIREVKPDVLVKGGDWREDEIIGGDYVRERGGKVVSIPLVDGYSTTKILDGLLPESKTNHSKAQGTAETSIDQHLSVIELLRSQCLDRIYECSEIIAETLRNGSKILLCGNGGSAADAQHIAAEFVGRYETERSALPAIALTTDTSALTALSNDYDFKRIFSRQVEALAKPGDCLIAISTSGESENVIAAVMSARNIGCRVIGMTGARGKKLASLCDLTLIVPADRTARIQEAHITVAHIWCELIDEEFTNPLT